ncbi:MAG TPA: 2-C-methyl-D-erythritol 2,4-cyclodiphosphate synthase [Terriglobales bacterium]
MSFNTQVVRVPRIGFGWDSHEFKPGIPLKIGGVLLPHESGLAGHSDGDVLLHALTDALLGAVAAGDIGSYFPPGDPQWKGADSAVFLREAMMQIARKGYMVGNVDCTLILAAPKIGPHAKAIQHSVAQLLGIDADQVGIKAKTPEGIGTDNAAIAQAVVLLTEIMWP